MAILEDLVTVDSRLNAIILAANGAKSLIESIVMEVQNEMAMEWVAVDETLLMTGVTYLWTNGVWIVKGVYGETGSVVLNQGPNVPIGQFTYFAELELPPVLAPI